MWAGDATQALAKTVTATAVASGAAPRGVARVVAGTVSAASTVMRAVDRVVSASVTVVGAILYPIVWIKGLASTVVSSGALVREAARTVLGTVAATGAIGRALGRTVSATVTAGGVVVRAVDRVVSGAVNVVSSMLHLPVFVKELAAATVNATGSLVRSSGKIILGTVTAAPAIVRGMTRTVVTTTTAAGAIPRAITKTLAAASVLITAFIFDIVHDIIVATQVTVSGSIPRAISRTVSGTVTILSEVGRILMDIAYTMNRTIRKIFAKVEITYTDPYFTAGILTSATEVGRGTYTAQTIDNVTTEEYKWFSLHRNDLTGSFHPLPGDREYSVGWWGTQLSAGVTGNFSAVYPTLTIETNPVRIETIPVVGDDKLVEYPVDFIVKLYTAGPTLVHTETITGNTQVTRTITLSPAHDDIVKLTLAISKWSRPLAVCKIAQCWTMLSETYYSEDGDLISVSVDEAREHEGSSIPQGNLAASEIVVRLNNIDDRFSPGNVASPLYEMLRQNRGIRAWLGVDLYPSGVRRWYPLGTFYSKDWSVPEDGIYAEVTGLDTLERLRVTEFSTSEVYVNHTLAELAIHVMTDAGLTAADWDIDAALSAITVPYAWFDRMSHREALRKIVAAALGQCYCNRDGKVVLEVYTPPADISFSYTMANVFSVDHPLAWSQVVNHVEAQAQPRVPAAEQVICADVETFSVPAGGTVTKTHFFTSVPCIDVLAPVIVGGADIHADSHVDYAWGSLVTYHNTGGGAEDVTSVTISGKPLEVVGGKICYNEDTLSIAANGKQTLSAPITSEFWQSEAMAQTVADDLLLAYKNPRRDAIMRARGNIAQLLGDRVLAPSFRDVVTGEYAVMSQGINYDGGLEVALVAQAIAAAAIHYTKVLDAAVTVTGWFSWSHVVLKTLTASVKVATTWISVPGGMIPVVRRAVGKILRGWALVHGAAGRVTSDMELTFQSSASDGYCHNEESGTPASYARELCDDATSADSAVTGETTVKLYGLFDTVAMPWARRRRGYLYFDTSTLPVGSTIVGVTLRLYITIDETDPAHPLSDLYVRSGQPTYPHSPLAVGDYDKARYATVGTLDRDLAVAGDWNEIALTTGSVTAGGTTKLCIAETSWGWNGYHTESYTVAVGAHATLKPELVVTYNFTGG